MLLWLPVLHQQEMRHLERQSEFKQLINITPIILPLINGKPNYTNCVCSGIWPQRFRIWFALEQGMPLELYPHGLAETGTGTGSGGQQQQQTSMAADSGKAKEKKHLGEEKPGSSGMEGEIRARALGEKKTILRISILKLLFIEISGKIGSEILVLAKPIEAHSLQIEFLEFHGGLPCLKLDFLGCQRSACEGKWNLNNLNN
jgi:hypothetical protein